MKYASYEEKVLGWDKWKEKLWQADEICIYLKLEAATNVQDTEAGTKQEYQTG